MLATPGFLSRLYPPTPISRRLAVQSLLFSMGLGTFQTGSAFYLIHFVGLSAEQIGLGLTIAGVASFVLALPTGRLADIVGPKRLWAICAFAGAVEFAMWPLIHGFATYIVVLLLFSIFTVAGGAACKAYILDLLPPSERVQTQAYMYSSLNVGFSAGALLAGAALAAPGDAVLRWGVPLISALLYLANCVWISRLPAARRDARQELHTPKRVVPTAPQSRGPLRNFGWVGASFLNGILTTHQVLLTTVIPLWLVAATDSPRWLLAWLLGTNTLLCIVLPPYATRGVRTMADALARIRWAGVFFVSACAITWVTHDTRGFLTALLIWLGHVAVTGAEIVQSACEWTMQAELMDPERRGEYIGVARAAAKAGNAWAPAVFTWLVIDWHDGSGGLGWAVVAGIYLFALVAFHPAVTAAERFRDHHFPAQEEVAEGRGA